MNINSTLAENLKRLRVERNLSLGQLAEASEVSKVMLSQIEKGSTNPTINTLWKIAHGLKVPYTALLEREDNLASITHKKNLVVQTSPEGNYRIACYYPSTPQRNFEQFMIEMDAGTQYCSIGHNERSLEYILVLEGSLRLEVNQTIYELAEGDAIEFSAAQKHIYKAGKECTLKAIIINFYPL